MLVDKLIDIVYLCTYRYSCMYVFFSWKSSQKNGYTTEQQYCQKNFLRRNSLLEIEVEYTKCVIIRYVNVILLIEKLETHTIHVDERDCN